LGAPMENSQQFEKDFQFFNLRTKEKNKFSQMFSDLTSNEVLVVLSPHDDDCLLGAGYCISVFLHKKNPIHIIIFHD
jgi:hypothetical protein